jgi:hypothetical protein
MSPDQLPKEEYDSILEKTWFVPCPRGQNAETFRFYEALEAGAIPLLIETDETRAFVTYIRQKLNIPVGSSWAHVKQILKSLLENPEALNHYSHSVQQDWKRWKEELIVKNI